jgi:hypothetical protein
LLFTDLTCTPTLPKETLPTISELTGYRYTNNASDAATVNVACPSTTSTVSIAAVPSIAQSPFPKVCPAMVGLSPRSTLEVEYAAVSRFAVTLPEDKPVNV